MLLVVHLLVLHAKQLLMKLLFESLQIYANLLLGLMPTNYIPTRCVNPCLPVFIRVGISKHRRVDLRFDKIRPAALKFWSCPISNQQDQIVKRKASLQQADRRKLTSSVLMGFFFSLQHCVWSHGLLLPLLICQVCIQKITFLFIFLRENNKLCILLAFLKSMISNWKFCYVSYFELKKKRQILNLKTTRQVLKSKFYKLSDFKSTFQARVWFWSE